VAYTPQQIDLTDLATVEEMQQLSSGNADEDYLQLLITAASTSILEVLGRHIEYVLPPDWTASKAYSNGQLIVPSGGANPGGYSFRCTSGGVSASVEPTSFPQTVGNTLNDGSLIWANVGQGVNTSEVLNGLGNNRLGILGFPVNSVGSVEIYGVFQTLAPSDSTDGVVAEIYGTRQRGMLYFRGIATWPFSGATNFVRGPQNIRVNYSKGWWTPGQAVTLLSGTPSSPAGPPSGVTALPIDLKNAATELAILKYRQRNRLGDSSVGEGPQRVTYFMKEMTDSVANVLNRYSDKSPW